MAFSLGPNGQFRSASAPGVGGCPPPTSPNVSSPKMSNLWQSDSFSFAPCAKVKTFQHLRLSQGVWVQSQFPCSKGRWGVWLLGVAGGGDARTARDSGTPPVTAWSHSGLGGASLCWASHVAVSPFLASQLGWSSVRL